MMNQPTIRHFSDLVKSIWMDGVWCALIGGVLGLAGAAISVFRHGPSQGSSAGMDIVSGTLAGVLMGVFFLAGPAALWSFGRWVWVGDRKAPTSASPVAAIEHDAMVGSSAAIPGAILGAVAGLAIDAGIVCLIGFVSLMTGTRWYLDVVKNWGFLLGLILFICTVTGVAAGVFLGSAVGAVVGGLRGLRRS